MNQLRRSPLIWLLAARMWVQGPLPLAAQDTPPAPAAFKPEEIEQLVAPIALYPDALLAQTLMASTYPLEVVEAARWVKANPKMEGKPLEDAMQQQTWDPSVKSLTAFPQVLAMMDEKLDWTQKLGDAFLAQQSDVMAAVQQLRAKAQAAGNLKTTKEQTVIVEQPPAAVDQKVVVQQQPAAPQTTIIKIEPANPQVVYVPTYNPTVVYGAWPYPAYPPYSYYPPGYVAATSILSFGVGLAVGAALWGGCNWGHGYGYSGGSVNVNVNNYNSFNKTNISNNNWQHNVDHRKGVQYRDQASQQRYGRGNQQAAASRDAFRGRAESGRQDLARGGAQGMQREGSRGPAGTGTRDAKAGQRQPGAGQRQPGTGERQAGAAQRQPGAGQRDTAAGNRANAGKTRDADAFQGMGNGAAARQDSDRGRASRQSASQWSGKSGGGAASASRGGGGGAARGGGGGARGGGGGGRGGGGRR